VLPLYSDINSIISSYRKQAMFWHPDRNSNRDALEFFIKVPTRLDIQKMSFSGSYDSGSY